MGPPLVLAQPWAVQGATGGVLASSCSLWSAGTRLGPAGSPPGCWGTGELREPGLLLVLSLLRGKSRALGAALSLMVRSREDSWPQRQPRNQLPDTAGEQRLQFSQFWFMPLIIELNSKITCTLFPHGKSKSSWVKCLSAAAGIFSLCSASPRGFPVHSSRASTAGALPRAAHGAGV